MFSSLRTVTLPFIGLMMFLSPEIHAQVKFSIPDPTHEFGIAELKKSESYKSQLKELGFTDADVTFKTYPVYKYYSAEAGPLTKSLVEADRSSFYLEATTKKDKNGRTYKLEGSIIFSRNDVYADQYGSWNANFKNHWQIYHLNVTDFLPTDQKYLIDPMVVKTLLMKELMDGTFELKGHEVISSDYFNDIIEFQDLYYVTDSLLEVNPNAGARSEVVNKSTVRMGFNLNYIVASFRHDTACIVKMEQVRDYQIEVTVEIVNGLPTLNKNFTKYHDYAKSTVLFDGQNYAEVYDTLFAPMKQVGFKNIYQMRTILRTGVMNGPESFGKFRTLHEKINALNGKTTAEMQQVLKEYMPAERAEAISTKIAANNANGFDVKATYDAVPQVIRFEYVPVSSKAEKGKTRSEYMNELRVSIRNTIFIGGKYKLSN